MVSRKEKMFPFNPLFMHFLRQRPFTDDDSFCLIILSRF